MLFADCCYHSLCLDPLQTDCGSTLPFQAWHISWSNFCLVWAETCSETRKLTFLVGRKRNCSLGLILDKTWFGTICSINFTLECKWTHRHSFAWSYFELYLPSDYMNIYLIFYCYYFIFACTTVRRRRRAKESIHVYRNIIISQHFANSALYFCLTTFFLRNWR